MFLISHRGNIDKKNVSRENSPQYIDEAIQSGFEVEIDVRIFPDSVPPGQIFLGHDRPEYRVDLDWLLDRKDKVWIHAKNLDAFSWFLGSPSFQKVFWHQEDDYTMTKNGYIWSYPGKVLGKKSIAVMPENSFYTKKDILSCSGVCSDNIRKYSEIVRKNYERKV